VNTGEQTTMTVPLEALSIATFDVKRNAWAWLPGKYGVFVGGSSRDLPLQSEAALY